MLITRTPLRISLGGGGTDLPSYYQRFGGYVVSAAISQYVYIGINRCFSNGYLLKYSELERAETVDCIRHHIFREALRLLEVKPEVEIVSMADVPAGTGLGSSGSFTVGLIRAIHGYHREYASARTIAEEACHIEIDVLNQPVGKQDQYIAAFGGLTGFDFRPDGTVSVESLNISQKTVFELEDRLLMFFTGLCRDSATILTDQDKRSGECEREILDNLHSVKALGLEIKSVLERGDTFEFGRLLNEHWLIKQKRSRGMSNSRINELYDIGLRNGALGGKLVGAGGGGFLLFYTEDKSLLRQAMSAAGLREMHFHFDFDGCSVITRS
jgi:D-glycero-alpha-D-manno-heptose-7-phosphate kinase